MKSVRRGAVSRPRSAGFAGSACRGFTILELMVVIAIAAILISVAIPSFRDAIERSERRGARSNILSAIEIARSEALSRAAVTTLCASTDGASCSGDEEWETGFIVRNGVDGVLWVGQKLPSGLTLRTAGFSDDDEVQFFADGLIPASGTFIVCDSKGATEALAVVVSISGLARLAVDSNGSGVVESHAGNASDVTCP